MYFEVWCSLQSNSLKDFWGFPPPWLFSTRSFGNLTSNNSIAIIYCNDQLKLSITPACPQLSCFHSAWEHQIWFRRKGSFAAIGCCMGHPGWYLVPSQECKVILQESILSIPEPISRLSPKVHSFPGSSHSELCAFQGPGAGELI